MDNITIALAGNPNCGKTTLFNALTGASQYVGNWPGVTVERKAGKLNEYPEIEVQDLPGIYSLSPYTLEEVISRDYLVRDEPSVIVDLVDATNLERNLYLTTQLQELGRPIIVALNMADLMARRGITIDKARLSQALHCQVVEISALKGTGIKELVELAVKTAKNPEASPAQPVRFDDTVEKALSRIAEYLSCDPDLKRWYAIKLFERDPKVVEHLHLDGQASQAIEQIIISVEEEMDDDSESIITSERYTAIAAIVKESQTKKHMGLSVSDKIDRIVTHRILALPIFFLVMWAVYYLSINTVGDWGTGWANDTFFGEIVGPWVDGFIGTAPAGIGLVAFIAVILSMIMLFPLLLRRPHDLNLKGAWMYLTIIPFILAFIVMPNVEEEEASEENTVPMEAPAAIPADFQSTAAEEGETSNAHTAVATAADAPAGEAAEPAEEGEKSDEGAVIGTLSSIMEFYDSCVKGLTSALGAVLLFLYKPLMWVLAAANAALLALCLFKPGARNKNEFGPVPDKSPFSRKNLAHIFSLKGRTGVASFWVQYIVLSLVSFGIALLGTLALNCDHKLVDFVQNAIVNGVGAELGFLPQMAVLFLCMAILEDCGYMARVAFVMDRIFRKFGLSGKSFIPMLVSMGCGVPGIMATRTIENEKDRRMTIILTTNMPCGAKIPIIAVLAFAFFPEDTGLVTTSAYFIGLASIIVSGIILKKSSLFAGDPAPFVMELPAYHTPAVSNVSLRAIERCKAFVQKAGTVIFLACALIWFLQSHDWSMTYLDEDHAEATASTEEGSATLPIEKSMLAGIGGAVSPVFAPLGWAQAGNDVRDWKPTVATITGLIAKENVVATMSMLYSTDIEEEEEEAPAEPEFSLFTQGNALSALTVAALDTWNSSRTREEAASVPEGEAPASAADEPSGSEQASAAAEEEALDEEAQEEKATAGVLRAANALGGDSIVAFSFLLFNLLCAPCFAAMGAMRREMNSAKWTWFAILWLCGWAYYVAFLVYQLGILVRDGTFGTGQVVALIGLVGGLYLIFRKAAPKKSIH